MDTMVGSDIARRGPDLEHRDVAAAASGASIRRPGGAWEWHQASALLHDFAEWILAAGGVDLMVDQPGFAAELADLPAVYDGEGAEMFVAFDDGLAIGTVAVRHHADGTSELKRMYVRRAARGRGVADRLVDHVARTATVRGSDWLWLETLRGAMDPAIRLYRRHGFVPAIRRSTIEHDGMLVMERQLSSRCAR
jgi:ribosomal protein S18 acetylase RimI-like enzyme